jgi:hypothetical protein
MGSAALDDPVDRCGHSGMVAHDWAMFAKGRLERKLQETQPWWVAAAEWVCWIMIAALIFYVAWSRMS